MRVTRASHQRKRAAALGPLWADATAYSQLQMQLTLEICNSAAICNNSSNKIVNVHMDL